MPCACPRPRADDESSPRRGQAQGIVPTHLKKLRKLNPTLEIAESFPKPSKLLV